MVLRLKEVGWELELVVRSEGFALVLAFQLEKELALPQVLELVGALRLAIARSTSRPRSDSS